MTTLVFLITMMAFSPPDSPDEAALRELLAHLQRSIHAGDTATAARLTRGLIPEKAHIAAALRDDSPESAAAAAKIEAYFRSGIPATLDEARLARVFAIPADRTEIRVRSASTEDLVTEAPPAQRFAGGALRLAKLLRPKTVFYTVDFIKPGERYGTSMELFFRYQDRWLILGPIWRMGIESGEKR